MMSNTITYAANPRELQIKSDAQSLISATIAPTAHGETDSDEERAIASVESDSIIGPTQPFVKARYLARTTSQSSLLQGFTTTRKYKVQHISLSSDQAAFIFAAASGDNMASYSQSAG
ncbi:hypothetical protein Tco_0109587 [Tanacetum coccineum]